MTGEEIRRIVEADFTEAASLLEQKRCFRVTWIDRDEVPDDFVTTASPAAIELFEEKRDGAKECYLDVTADEVEFKGKTFEPLTYLIADQTDNRLRKDLNYVQVQQFNRAFITKLLEDTLGKFIGVESRVAGKIVAELLQQNYPL